MKLENAEIQRGGDIFAFSPSVLSSPAERQKPCSTCVKAFSSKHLLINQWSDLFQSFVFSMVETCLVYLADTVIAAFSGRNPRSR